MGTVYVLGAGFSKTCGIATDAQMLDALNPLLAAEEPRIGGTPKTAIESLREQVFPHQSQVSFELFMSTLSSLKFTGDYLKTGRNIFREEEREVRSALRRYLRTRVSKVDWSREGRVIVDFVKRVNWERDFVLTFNYDLLLEAAAQQLSVRVNGRIIHLHGAIGERIWAWPTYIKFAYRTTKEPLAPRWKRAFEILRNQLELERLVFIGYSMPPSDLEAKALFNYADLYNHLPGAIPFYRGKLVPAHMRYNYDIVVVNPAKAVARNYAFFRKDPVFRRTTLKGWLAKP